MRREKQGSGYGLTLQSTEPHWPGQCVMILKNSPPLYQPLQEDEKERASASGHALLKCHVCVCVWGGFFHLSRAFSGNCNETLCSTVDTPLLNRHFTARKELPRQELKLVKTSQTSQHYISGVVVISMWDRELLMHDSSLTHLMETQKRIKQKMLGSSDFGRMSSFHFTRQH